MKPRWLIAPFRQAAEQEPQPLQSASLTVATITLWPKRSTSFNSIAVYGQDSTQKPQPRQRPSSTLATVASIINCFLESILHALDAAPLACATVSGTSFGLWQQPARKTPSVKVSTGRSLG